MCADQLEHWNSLEKRRERPELRGKRQRWKIDEWRATEPAGSTGRGDEQCVCWGARGGEVAMSRNTGFRMCATQPQTLPELLSSPLPSCASAISSLSHPLVAPPGSILLPSSLLRPAARGLTRPLPHLTPLPGPGPGAPLARRTQLGRDPSEDCRTGAVEPSPTPQPPRQQHAAASRPLPDLASLCCLLRPNPSWRPATPGPPRCPSLTRERTEAQLPRPGLAARLFQPPPAPPSWDPAPRRPTQASIAPFRRHAEFSFFNWVVCLLLK